MKFSNKIRIAGSLALAGIMGVTNLSARENITSTHHKSAVEKTTATGCVAATAAIDLDINNVRARLMTGGDMWWNIGTAVAAYEIPKGSGKSSQFAASCWIGGYDKQGQLKVAAQTYRQDGNDYWPGILDPTGKVTQDVCKGWDYFWKVDRATIKRFVANYATGGDNTSTDFDAINYWPATGNSKIIGNQGAILSLNSGYSYAPFVDYDGDGLYDPTKGDYPNINGDEYIWWVFNDAGNVKQQSLTASMGVEVQTSAFAYATQDFLNNSTFCNYRVINRGPLTIDSAYIAVWDDCDLGYYYDDFIGCDTTRGLGIQYNGTNDDGLVAGHPVNSYGPNPPQVGLDFFQGPIRIVHRSGGLKDTSIRLGMTNFTYYNNDGSIIGNPTNGIQIYGYMTGTIRDGEHFSYDYNGAGVPSKGYGAGPSTHFVFWGDPEDNSQWSECACSNTPSDRRFIFSSGPFTLEPGAVNDITFGCVWAAGVGGCPSTSFKTIKNIDDQAQALFDNHFKTVEGPEAPTMSYRVLDRKIILWLSNPSASNNFGENYGRTDGAYNDSLKYHQRVAKAGNEYSDSLYVFQGYRVFQLANSQVTAAEIFDPTTGEVDNTKAYEVFQCDIHDGVTQITNYVKRVDIDSSPAQPQLKVVGKDSGIVHSFVLTQDQFSATNDKAFVNYHNYYFVAIAYAYNNFKQFDPKNFGSTQDAAYLGSAHGAGGIDIPVLALMPDPANGAMGTVINSDYGEGVSVTRIEGIGNGGNYVQLNDASTTEALTTGQATKLVYESGLSPVNIKVLDPVKVPAANWVLQINGSTDATSGALSSASNWTLLAKGTSTDTIYSEENLSKINEQIASAYGLSITIGQVSAPGVDQVNGNGYIGSSVEFEDQAYPWLFGVRDQPDSNFANWLRSGNNQRFKETTVTATYPCWFNDNKLDTFNAYGNMMANFSPTTASWGPYGLAAYYYSGGHFGTGTQCGFEVAANPLTVAQFKTLTDVDLVFTSDKSKWTRCAVVEEQEDPLLAQGGVTGKFYLRKHASWNLDVDASGNPVYASDATTDYGMSWFPGYAINQMTGERLNIVFGEDSYLSSDNGNDMLFNPSSTEFNSFDNSIVFGGKHIVYVLGTKYDQDSAFTAVLKTATPTNLAIKTAYSAIWWVGLPLLNPALSYNSAGNGIIPSTPGTHPKTTVHFRVDRPYAKYAAVDTTTLPSLGINVAPGTATNPIYVFSTDSLAPHAVDGTTNKDALLKRIYAVPNPYYGYSGYETNRYDTKVRIINLPAKVTVYIYALDGALIRTLTKNDPNSAFLDWDIRNSAGLPIASGMYLMDVHAEGIGETVIKWFGATRPLDVTTY